jgi:hypothetical protein
MRRLGTIFAVLCAIGVVSPAQAVELKFCDDIKDDPQARMACLQAHISHLEDTILRLDAQVAEMGKELEQKLSANTVYKVQSVAQGKCLGFAGANQALAVLTCDHPDSWKLLTGSQSAPKPNKPVAKPNDNTTPKPDDKATPKPDDTVAPKSDDKGAAKSEDQGTAKPDKAASKPNQKGASTRSVRRQGDHSA